MKKVRNNKKPGFTLVEMVIVVTILGILSGLGFAKFDQVQVRARENADYVAAANLATAANLYKNDNPNAGAGITLEVLKENSYINSIPKPQSQEGSFSISVDTEEGVKVKIGDEIFYPKKSDLEE